MRTVLRRTCAQDKSPVALQGPAGYLYSVHCYDTGKVCLLLMHIYGFRLKALN